MQGMKACPGTNDKRFIIPWTTAALHSRLLANGPSPFLRKTYPQLTSRLSAGPWSLFVLVCRHVDQHLFASVVDLIRAEFPEMPA